MTETFHDLIFRTKGVEVNIHTSISVSEDEMIEKNPIGVKVFDWDASDGLAVNRHICCEIKSSFQNRDGYKNGNVVTKHMVCYNEYVAAILDELGAFEIDVCKSAIADLHGLKNVLLLQETNSLRFFVSVCKFIQEGAAFSDQLKLIVIYCSGETLERIMKLLKNLRHRDLKVLVATTGKWPQSLTIFTNAHGEIVIKKTSERRNGRK